MRRLTAAVNAELARHDEAAALQWVVREPLPRAGCARPCSSLSIVSTRASGGRSPGTISAPLVCRDSTTYCRSTEVGGASVVGAASGAEAPALRARTVGRSCGAANIKTASELEYGSKSERDNHARKHDENWTTTEGVSKGGKDINTFRGKRRAARNEDLRSSTRVEGQPHSERTLPRRRYGEEQGG